MDQGIIGCWSLRPNKWQAKNDNHVKKSMGYHTIKKTKNKT